MSNVKIQSNASGTGTLTIAAPNTNTDRTLTLPDSSGTMATAESTLAQFNASGSAPVYAARAWVNFNGTGTVAIRASGNVSSITDTGVGNYTVNFTTALPDGDYSTVATGSFTGTPNVVRTLFVNSSSLPSTTSVSLYNRQASAAEDCEVGNVAIFR